MVGHQDPRIFEDSPQIEGFCAARTVPRSKLVFCLHRLPLPPLNRVGTWDSMSMRTRTHKIQQTSASCANLTIRLLPANASIPPHVLLVLNNEHLTKDGLALEFLVEVFVTFKQEKGTAQLVTILRKGGLDQRLLDFLPINKRSEEHLKAVFVEKDLADIFKLHKAQASQEAKRELTQVRALQRD